MLKNTSSLLTSTIIMAVIVSCAESELTKYENQAKRGVTESHSVNGFEGDCNASYVLGYGITEDKKLFKLITNCERNVLTYASYFVSDLSMLWPPQTLFDAQFINAANGGIAVDPSDPNIIYIMMLERTLCPACPTFSFEGYRLHKVNLVTNQVTDISVPGLYEAEHLSGLGESCGGYLTVPGSFGTAYHSYPGLGLILISTDSPWHNYFGDSTATTNGLEEWYHYTTLSENGIKQIFGAPIPVSTHADGLLHHQQIGFVVTAGIQIKRIYNGQEYVIPYVPTAESWPTAVEFVDLSNFSMACQ